MSRSLVSFVLLVALLLTAGAASAAVPPPQAGTPTAGPAEAGATATAAAPTAAVIPLGPTVNAYSFPRQVIYLSPFPAEHDSLTLEGYKSLDPLGKGLFYAFDADGDGRFTEFSIPTATRQDIHVAGPFDAAVRVQDALGRIAEQRLPMVARQFTTSYVDSGDLVWPSAAAVAGRPAVAYLDTSVGLKFAINSQADGGGSWITSVALPNPAAVCPCQLAVLSGRPAISYTDEAQQSAAIVVNDRADGSGEWRNQLVVGPTTQAFPSLLETGPLAIMSFYQGGQYLGLTATGSAEGNWKSMAAAIELGNSGWGTNSMALVGEPAERPAIAYLKTPGGLTLSVAKAADGAGGWPATSIPGTGGAYAPSLAMLHTGPAVAYRDYKTGNLMFAASSKPDGSGGWKLTTVYPSARGGAPYIQSLALVDGRPAIAFESDKKGVVFAYNSEADGSGQWSYTVLERRAAGTGQNPSLAVVAGRPVVAFVAASGQGIKIAVAR